MLLQHLQDDLALQFAHALTGKRLQGNRPVQRDLGIEEIRLACNQVVGDYFLMAQDHVTLDQIFEFADVSRPVIFLQHRQHFIRQGPCSAVELAVVEFEEVGAQTFNVATAFPQRRHVQIHHVDAVVKILAESSRFNLGFEAAVGRAHDADLDLLVFLGADPAELPVLQKLQKLRLQRGVKLGNLVEKQCSAVGEFDASWLRANGAGKGSSFVAEQFAFQQRPGNRWAVYLYIRPALPGRQPVDEPGNDVFPGAALTCNKDRNVGGGYFSQPRTNRLHGLRVAKNYLVRGKLAERLCQRTYRKCRHKTEYPVAVSVHPHALKVHPKHQTREESRTTWKSSPKRSTYEQLEVIISREWEDRAWHQSAIMRQAMEGKNSSHRRTRFPQMLAGNSRRVGVQGTGELQTQ